MSRPSGDLARIQASVAVAQQLAEKSDELVRRGAGEDLKEALRDIRQRLLNLTQRIEALERRAGPGGAGGR